MSGKQGNSGARRIHCQGGSRKIHFSVRSKFWPTRVLCGVCDQLVCITGEGRYVSHHLKNFRGRAYVREANRG